MSLQPANPAPVATPPRATPPAPQATNGLQTDLKTASQPNPSRLPKPKGLSRSVRLLLLLGGLGVVGTATGAAYYLIGRGPSARTDLVTHRVGYENLQLTITERGALEAADNRDVYCRVKARSQQSTVATTIKWVIDDGSLVKPGQLLVELDDSGLGEQQKNQKI